LPRTYHGWNQIEVDAVVAVPMDERGHRVARAAVDIDYLDALGAPVSQGRGFTLTDLDSGARVVLVDRPFVERVLGDANPIGRRIRYVASESFRVPTTEGPWYEIVGVAPDLGIRTDWGYGGIYHPARPGTTYPLQLILHTRGDPEAIVPRLRAVAAAVDTRLRLHEPLPLDESTRLSEAAFYDFWTTLAFLFCGIALLVSLAAIYSVTSFTVVRRTREIGVRVALGGRALHVVGTVLKRPLMQVSKGIALGLLITWGLRSLANGYGLGSLATIAAGGSS
jgi:putative ABC transport system permease protein